MSSKIIVIIVALVLVLSLLFWLMQKQVTSSSPERKEALCKAALFSNVKQLQYQAARQMRDFKTKTAVFTLIKKLNELNFQDTEERNIGEEVVASLFFLTGKKFGTNIEGTEYNYGWSPPSVEDWPFILYNVNVWAKDKFTIDTLKQYSISLTIIDESQLPQVEEENEEYVEPPLEEEQPLEEDTNSIEPETDQNQDYYEEEDTLIDQEPNAEDSND